MKPRSAVRFLRFLGIIPLVVLLGGAGCSREANETRAESQIGGGKLVIAGARPQFPAGTAPSMHGFLEELRWDPRASTLELKGWAPLDVRPDSVRFVLRDPFDRLRLASLRDFVVHERTDVLKEHSHLPGIRFSGFTAAMEVANPPRRSSWPESLEVYCLDGDGAFYRLHRADAPSRQSWDRRRDWFEIVLTYSPPEIAGSAETAGNLDVFEAAGDHALRLAGWAPFDGQSPESVLIVQLPATAAPASIVSGVWFARPDVRAAVAPARAELERSGFDLTLQIRTSSAELAHSGRLNLWAIDADGHVSALAQSALEKR